VGNSCEVVPGTDLYPNTYDLEAGNEYCSMMPCNWASDGWSFQFSKRRCSDE